MRRAIDFVTASQPHADADVSLPCAVADDAPVRHKRRRSNDEPATPLASYVRTGRFEILVADPRPIDVNSQSLTFDEAAHAHMQADMGRCATFEAALRASADSKTVLEIGTGPSALLALSAARAGASRVYAVEADPASAAAARRHLAQSAHREKFMAVGSWN